MQPGSFSWTTGGIVGGTAMDLFSAMLGSVGFMIGLSSEVGARDTVMTGTVAEGLDGIGTEDIAAVCALYGAGGFEPVDPEGFGEICGPCDTETDCVDDARCVGLPGGESTCLQSCESDTDCPEGATCVAGGSIRVCASEAMECIPPSGGGDDTGTGDAGGGDDVGAGSDVDGIGSGGDTDDASEGEA
ncbi:MAG: hypothetical protein KDA28_04425, partial [Phycisphaerales bacterium]|nr:hypothetical protein [Phycisphaerales bacterium]